MIPQEILLKLDSLRLLLRPFWNRNRSVVATWLTVIYLCMSFHRKFAMPYTAYVCVPRWSSEQTAHTAATRLLWMVVIFNSSETIADNFQTV